MSTKEIPVNTPPPPPPPTPTHTHRHTHSKHSTVSLPPFTLLLHPKFQAYYPSHHSWWERRHYGLIPIKLSATIKMRFS